MGIIDVIAVLIIALVAIIALPMFFIVLVHAITGKRRR